MPKGTRSFRIGQAAVEAHAADRLMPETNVSGTSSFVPTQEIASAIFRPICDIFFRVARRGRRNGTGRDASTFFFLKATPKQ